MNSRVKVIALLMGVGAPLLPLATVSAAREKEPGGPPTTSALAQAREESAVGERPPSTYELPAGELAVSPPEALASVAGQPIRFSVRLDRPVEHATLSLSLPSAWLRERASGLPAARQPRILRRAGGAADLERAGQRAELSLDQAAAGQIASFEITDVGIPAGTYRLPISWREAGRSPPAGAGSRAGVVRIVILAAVREDRGDGGRLANPGVAQNVASDSVEESETFIATTPANKNRIAVGSNWQNASMPAWISNDAGQTWVERTLPSSIDAPAESGSEAGNVCCDPTFAADGLGNIWFGGLALANGAGVPSRIVVNRIAAGTNTFRPLTVGLPTRTSGTQDKPMMTIDNSASSPTFGRLYMVWDEPAASGGVNLVISQCDTRPGGVADAAHCDNADNWSTPASVTPSGGSYIYGDVAVGPDGQVYVTWWDYSSTNAIRGDVCDPAAHNCASASGWGTPQTIAILDSTGGKPVPFACPILAQPGGRAAPAPQVDVDHSGGPQDDRVYVTWGDLRPGSGTTRCGVKPNGDGTTPASTHLTWDSFVASAPNGALPGGSTVSTSVGTRLYTDGEGGGSSNSDDWFSWLAVDQTTGQAWADFYSTRDDSTRKTTNFYARSVTPSGGGHTLGTLTRVSAAPSDYSANRCCKFGNDYGDYTGIDATSGIAYPVWTDNSTGDGEPFTFVTQLAPPSAPPGVTTGTADSIGQTSATLHGTVDPNGQSTTYRFEYGKTTGYGSKAPVPDGNAGSGTTSQPVSASISALDPGTTYHFRLVATNGSGTTNGADHTFSTASPPPPGSPPSVVTGTADSIGASTATVHGTVNPNGQSTTYHFQYGIDQGASTAYSSTADQSAGAGSSDLAASADLSGLAPATTYRYRLVASNVSGSSTGGEATFKTAPGALDTTPPAVGISGKDVRLTQSGLARVRVSCPASEPDPSCDGGLRLKTAHRVRFGGRRQRVLLGKHGFSILSGESQRVGVQLSARKRRLVERLGALRVKAAAVAQDLAGNVGTSTQRFRLLAP